MKLKCFNTYIALRTEPCSLKRLKKSLIHGNSIRISKREVYAINLAVREKIFFQNHYVTFQSFSLTIKNNHTFFLLLEKKHKEAT